jgi:hypothetical protein
MDWTLSSSSSLKLEFSKVNNAVCVLMQKKTLYQPDLPPELRTEMLSRAAPLAENLHDQKNLLSFGLNAGTQNLGFVHQFMEKGESLLRDAENMKRQSDASHDLAAHLRLRATTCHADVLRKAGGAFIAGLTTLHGAMKEKALCIGAAPAVIDAFKNAVQAKTRQERALDAYCAPPGINMREKYELYKAMKESGAAVVPMVSEAVEERPSLLQAAMAIRLMADPSPLEKNSSMFSTHMNRVVISLDGDNAIRHEIQNRFYTAVQQLEKVENKIAGLKASIGPAQKITYSYSQRLLQPNPAA